MRILPILFNTEMVRALLEERKSATRRVVKYTASDVYKSACFHGRWYEGMYVDNLPLSLIDWYCKEVKRPPYKPGDILYVRETWCNANKPGYEPDYYYFADTKYVEDYYPPEWKWRPSIHMPCEAARIFLKVKAVRAERLQDITEEQARAEGAKPAFEYNTMDGPVITFDEDGYFYYGYKALWNYLYAKPMPVREQGKVVRYESYPWENIQETKTYRGKPWLVIGNPWLWVIEFARTDKPEGWTHGKAQALDCGGA